MVHSSYWEKLRPGTWSIILRLTGGFIFFNITFLSLNALLFHIFKLLFKPQIIDDLVYSIGSILSVISFPSYFPGEKELRQQQKELRRQKAKPATKKANKEAIQEEFQEKENPHEKKKRERNSAAALVSKSIVIAVVIVSITDTVPNLLGHMDHLLRSKFHQEF